jgi:hypothetical protein
MILELGDGTKLKDPLRRAATLVRFKRRNRAAK